MAYRVRFYMEMNAREAYLMSCAPRRRDIAYRRICQQMLRRRHGGPPRDRLRVVRRSFRRARAAQRRARHGSGWRGEYFAIAICNLQFTLD
jgi:hypothetical protein